MATKPAKKIREYTLDDVFADDSAWDEILYRQGIGTREDAPVEVKDEGFIDDMGTSISQGIASTGRGLKSAYDTVMGNLTSVEETAKAQQEADKNKPLETQQLMSEIERRKQANPNASVMQAVGDVAGAAWNNKEGTAQLVASQLPNTGVALGGAWAGGKAGAMAGGAVAGPVGAVAGGVLGGLAGMFLGNFALETGGKAIEKAAGGYTPQEASDALTEGAKKAGVITGVDYATLGAGRLVSKAVTGTAVRAGARAEAKVLADAGVDISDGVKIAEALRDPALKTAASEAGRVAAKEASKLGNRAIGAGTGLTLETLGEGVGEYAGEEFATGKGDLYDAALESISSLSQSGIQTAQAMRDTGYNPGSVTQIVVANPMVERLKVGAATPDGHVARAAIAGAAIGAIPDSDAISAKATEIEAVFSGNSTLGASLSEFGDDHLSAFSTALEIAKDTKQPTVARQEALQTIREALTLATSQDIYGASGQPTGPVGPSVGSEPNLAAAGMGAEPSALVGIQPDQTGAPLANVVPSAGDIPGATDAPLNDQNQPSPITAETQAAPNQAPEATGELDPAAIGVPAAGAEIPAVQAAGVDAQVAQPDVQPVVQPTTQAQATTDATNSAAAAQVAQVAQTPKIEGEPINGTWTKFAPESGTLNIPRKEMPQIKSEHRGAMTNFLNAREVESVSEVVPAASLKPTQHEFSPAKVRKAEKFEGDDRPILISEDGHILDGHHQWLAKKNKGEDVKVTRLNAPIGALLELMQDFPSAGMTKAPEPIQEKSLSTVESENQVLQPTETINGTQAQEAVTPKPGQQGPQPTGQPAAAQPTIPVVPAAPQRTAVPAPVVTANQAPSWVMGPAVYRKRVAEIASLVNQGFTQIEDSPQGVALVNPQTNQAHPLTGSPTGIEATAAKNVIAKATPAVYAPQQTTGVPNDIGRSPQGVQPNLGRTGASGAESVGGGYNPLSPAGLPANGLQGSDAGGNASGNAGAQDTLRLTQEREAIAELNAASDGRSKEVAANDPRRKALTPLLDVFERFTGHRPILIDNDRSDGITYDGRTFLSVNNPDMPPGWTVGHEFVHLTRKHPKLRVLYAQIAALVDKEAGKRKYYDYLVRNKTPSLIGSTYDTATAEQIALLEEEMVADYIGKMLVSERLMTDFARKKPHLFGQFIKEWIPTLRGIIASLRGMADTVRGVKNVEAYITHTEKAKAVAEKVFEVWATERPGFAKQFDADAIRNSGKTLQEDITKQEQWLQKRAQESGYKDVEDLFMKNAKLFNQLAKEWRELNPAEVLNSKKESSPPTSGFTVNGIDSQQFNGLADRMPGNLRTPAPILPTANRGSVQDAESDLQQELQDEQSGAVSDERIKAQGLHAEEAYANPEWVKKAGGLLRTEVPNLYTEGHVGTIQLEPEESGLWGAAMRGTWIGPADIEATGYVTLNTAKKFIKRFIASKDLLKRGFDILTATDKKDQLADDWMAIGKVDKATRYARGEMAGYPMKVIAQKMGITDKYDVSVMTEKLDPKIIAYVLEFTNKETGEDQSAMLEITPQNGKQIAVAHTASLTKGGLGAGVYQMFAEFAAGKGLQIHPDESLSGINTYRRTEQMLSAALRTGKSNVMIPHAVQRVYGFNNDASTEQEHKDNIARLLLTGLRNARELMPQLDKLTYSPKDGKFFYNGKDAEAVVMKMLADTDARAFGLGRSTLARAVMTKDMLAGTKVKTGSFKESVLYSVRDNDMFSDDFADENTTIDTGIVISSKGQTMLGGNKNSDGQQITSTKQGLENFWRWFGQSEATDDGGKPLVMYHSTNADTNTLRPNQKTTNNYGLLGDVETSRAGIFATPEREFSQEYLREGDGKNVMQIYMSLQKPFDTRKGISESMEAELEEAGVSTRWLANVQNDWEMYDNDDNGENFFVEKLKELGYDGAIFNEDGQDGKLHTTYMAFNPSQIKSATGNRGTFDGSGDVRYSTKPRDASTHVLSVARDERVTSDNTSISADEEKVIKEAARKMKTSTSEVEALVRENKSNHPESDGWAELTLTGVKEKLDDDGEPTGKFDLVYKTVPYQFNTGDSGKALKPGTKEYANEVNRLSESMLQEVRSVFDRAQSGDAAAKVIIAQAGWYKEMRTRLRQEFGGLGDLFADLLGATSPNTPVRTNWDNSVEALRMAAAGEYDDMITKWLQWADGVKAMETRFKEFVNAMLDAGMTQVAIKEMGEYKWLKEQASASRTLPDELIPRKENGKRFGFNGKNVVRAMIDLWRVVKNADTLIGRGGTAPKAINFSGNLIGFRSRATIDVWAARMLQRIYGGKRIASSAEGGVTGEARKDGTNTLQFGFGQDVFAKTAGLIRRDVEMSENQTLRSINDDDLQALVWFIEKEVWTKNNWTSAAGEGGSFEFESDLAGVLDRAKVNEIRKVMDSSVSATPEQKARAEIVLEATKREMESALAAAQDKDARNAIKAGESYKGLQKILNKQRAILKKPTAEENLAARGEAVAQLKEISSTLNRYFGGISLQQGAEQGVAPTIVSDAEMAALSQDVRDAIASSDSGATVIGVKAISTEGRYGDPERALDLEVIVRDGFNPKPMAAAVFKAAEKAKQDAAFIARVLKPNEAFDPLKHRPGIEIYFQDMKQAKEAAKMMSEIVAQRTSKPLDVGPGYFEISGFTVVVDGRITPETRAGAMGTPVGMRIIYLPEFEARYGIDPRLENSTDEELSAIIKERARDLRNFAESVLGRFSGVSFAGRFNYEVDVRFSGEYQGAINDYTNSAASAGNRGVDSRPWSGRTNRESIAAATGRLQVNGSQPGAKLQDRDGAVKASVKDAGGPSDRPRKGDSAAVRQAVHYGRLPGLTTLSGQSFGTGIKGAEQERLSTATDPRIKQRVYFYAPVAGGIPNPEVGLGGNVYTADLDNIYDPRIAKSTLRGSGNALESAVLDAGYDGYTDPESGVIVMLGRDVPVKHIGGLGDFKVVQRQVERIIPKNVTRSEGDYLVRRPEGPEMLALANPAKQAKVKAAAPSFALQYGEFRVKADEAPAADAALAEFSPSFRFASTLFSIKDDAELQAERRRKSIDALRRMRKCLG